MRLFVGLGNPGAKYAGNRHNLGFMVLDRIAADHGFPAFRAKFQGLISEGRLGAERIVLLKPETFMNLSGQSVRAAMDFYKIDAPHVLVFHDEVDLAPFKVRIKKGGGHAGHNGLRSLHAHIGADYARVRIGVGHPGQKDRVAAYLLSDFAKAEGPMLDDLLRGMSEGAPALAADDGARFLNAVAARTAPPRRSTGTGRPADAPPPEPAPVRAGPDASEAPPPAPGLFQKLLDRFR